MYHLVVWLVSTDVSAELTASIIRVMMAVSTSEKSVNVYNAAYLKTAICVMLVIRNIKIAINKLISVYKLREYQIRGMFASSESSVSLSAALKR
jgi:hypothetical protein